MEKDKFDESIRNITAALTYDLFEYSEALWDAINQKKYIDLIDDALIHGLIMDHLVKIYISYRRQDKVLDEVYHILNTSDNLQ